MKTLIAWVRANPNKCGVLSWTVYSWAKAVAAARFNWNFLPETDMLVMGVFTALGLHSVTRKTPPTQ